MSKFKKIYCRLSVILAMFVLASMIIVSRGQVVYATGTAGTPGTTQGGNGDGIEVPSGDDIPEIPDTLCAKSPISDTLCASLLMLPICCARLLIEAGWFSSSAFWDSCIPSAGWRRKKPVLIPLLI